MSVDTIPIIVLIVLYAMQGIPMGLFWGAMPYILSANPSFTYSDQAIFSLSSYPYSLKLFWSPIVDSMYFQKFGRRKSWIFPSQNIMGILMIYISYNIDEWIDHKDIYTITIWCFVLIFFTATQDIAVDGWSLTILSKENVSFQSTAQSFGMTLGYTIGFPLFLALNSEEICCKYFGSQSSMVTLSSFFYISGILMILISIIISLFVSEKPDSNMETLSIYKTYAEIFKIFKIRNVMELSLILLSRSLTFTTIDSVTQIKLQKQGFPKETSGLLVFVYVPFKLSYPLILRYLTKYNNLSYLMQWKYAYILRIIIGLIGAYNVYYFELDSDGHVPHMFVMRLIIITISYSFVCSIMFTNKCSFFAEIADPFIGATYMTFLNTVSNFGSTWPRYFILKAVDMFTIQKEESIQYDGYYIMIIFCALYGIIWINAMHSTLVKLDKLPKETSWSIIRHKKTD